MEDLIEYSTVMTRSTANKEEEDKLAKTRGDSGKLEVQENENEEAKPSKQKICSKGD